MWCTELDDLESVLYRHKNGAAILGDERISNIHPHLVVEDFRLRLRRTNAHRNSETSNAIQRWDRVIEGIGRMVDQCSVEVRENDPIA
jgi:hypothetical protein